MSSDIALDVDAYRWSPVRYTIQMTNSLSKDQGPGYWILTKPAKAVGESKICHGTAFHCCCTAACSRWLLPRENSRITDLCPRRSTAAITVMGFLKTRSHSENTIGVS